jgi:sec-independent protein translocase protein TatA
MGLDNPLHIAFLVVILLLVFGARRLPEIGRSLGSGMREFKTSVTGEMSHTQQTLPPASAQQQPAPPAQTQPPPATQAPPPAQTQPPPATQAPPTQAQAAQAPVAEPVATPAVPPQPPPVS